jgi:UDP-glucose 4-epimerase
MRVLVTGGAGFIGSHIVDTLLARGHHPFVVDNLVSGRRDNLSPGVALHEVDICDAAKLAVVFDDVRPDWVCHQAAQVSVSRSMRDPAFDMEVNVLGLLRILENAARVGVRRIVCASSGGVLYGDVSEPAQEDHPARPVSPYGLSKWAGEQYLAFYVRERRVQGVALRYSNVYGPRQNPHGEAGAVAIFSQRMLSGQVTTINGDGHYIRDYVYGTDVALANALALEATLSTDFVTLNIGTGIGTDVNDLAEHIRANVQRHWTNQGRKETVPACVHGEPRSGDLRSNLVCAARARSLLNWEPTVSLAEGLQLTVNWFAEHQNDCVCS